MENILYGRDNEKKLLNELFDSGRPELVALYGRRRVGKTYLVDFTFENRFAFRHAGLSPELLKKNNVKDKLNIQLKHFYNSLIAFGMKKSGAPKDWFEAFELLKKLLEDKYDGTRQLVFIDELPWLDTPRSNFLSAFDGFWNNWACYHRDVMVIVCGSATSWILNKLIHGRGGFYGRVTRAIKLTPFTLSQCEGFLKELGFHYSRYDIVQTYMILGGIPYYLKYLNKEYSLALNIDALFFSQDAPLKEEFDDLFLSIFTNPEELKKIVIALSSKRIGLTRGEILKAIKKESSGNFTNQLKSLCSSDFVNEYVPFGGNKKEPLYKLVDPFCLFYLYFIKNEERLPANFYSANTKSQKINSWRGISFENVCFNHIDSIKRALNILGVYSKQSAYVYKPIDGGKGTQIDLLINRDDNIVNICEMKFYSEPLTIDSSLHEKIQYRQSIIEKKISRKQAVHNVLVTTFGIRNNEYRNDFVSIVTLQDLFKE